MCGSAGAIGRRSEQRSSGHVIVSPTARRPVGGALAPVADLSLGIWDSVGSGVCGFTHGLSGAWQERKGDHVWEKRRSKLDLLGCDPGPGHAARGFNTRETELAYRSLRLRDDARAASSSSPVVCRIVGAPPLCAPARVIPGRTLLEGESRVGSQTSPQLQGTSFFKWWWPAGVPVPVPPETPSAPSFPGFPITIAVESGVPLAQQPVRPFRKWEGALSATTPPAALA
jgi:hypothetical protein